MVSRTELTNHHTNGARLLFNPHTLDFHFASISIAEPIQNTKTNQKKRSFEETSSTSFSIRMMATSKPWTPAGGGDAMKDLIRQRLGLAPLKSEQPPTTELTSSQDEEMIDYDDNDDEGNKDECGFVCKCCKKCTEFVPKRNELSKGPRHQEKSKRKGQQNNSDSDTQRRMTGKRKSNNNNHFEEDLEDEEVEKEQEQMGSICASCGCGLIHHLSDDWEVDNDERDEDYRAEYGGYDDD